MPARPADVPGMKGRRDQATLLGLSPQHPRDGRLLDTVLANWFGAVHFGYRQLQAGAMHPDRTTVDQMLNVPPQTFDQ